MIPAIRFYKNAARASLALKRSRARRRHSNILSGQKTSRNQRASFPHFDHLINTYEFAALSHALPFICSSIINLLYAISSGELSSGSQSEQGLVVHIAVIYALHTTLIRKLTSSVWYFTFQFTLIHCSTVLLGRILHMFAVKKMKLLQLWQIFVLYVSHEIRWCYTEG